MLILETQPDIDVFLNYWNTEPCLIFPIWCDLEKHPMNNEISFLYVRFRDDETDQDPHIMDYILPFNHNDCEPLHLDLSNSLQQKKVYNKKGLLQTNLNIQNLYDIHSEIFFDTNKHFNIDEELEVLTNFYTRLGLCDDLGKSIPIMKWIEVLREVSNPIEPLLSSFTDTWINTTMIPTLSRIEQMGLNVDTKKFIDRWPSHGKQLNGDKIYTEYNPYTTTSRPSNRHGGINFGALNKKDGTREIFIPQKDKTFLQFDYDAYHVRIIGKLINYELPETSAHQWLADMYGCSYDESKGRTFRILYGGVNEEDKKIPFFFEVDKYIQKMYKTALKNGYVKTPKGRTIKLDWIEDHNAQKVFNYILQATETELNIDIIEQLYIAGISNLCLYSYDAFLFEYDKNGGTSQAKSIQTILEQYGFPVRKSWGSNYSNV